MTTRIFTPIKVILREEIILSKSATHYLLNVLRAKAGMNLVIFNGEGAEYQAKLVNADKKGAVLFIESKNEVDRESPIQIHLAQGVSKGERMDYCIQKSVELGVAQITPILTARCNVKLPQDRLQKRVQHWQQVAISSAEQSGRTKVPTVNLPLPLHEFLNQAKGLKLIADTKAQAKLKSLQAESSVTLLIGPEGGFTDEEIELARQHGFKAFTLGPRTLRTETAGPAAITLLQGLFGDI